ncbi:MAG: tRNA preQ1(34) S-adenosylmethionine ribosyltransferase-isomerase QueA, partial [Chloroflexi bacterium]|nr:tRNA preQ1(34) S-adenosylmethionine ribosyltransferase-isomerase QueA [Chloroflexota bacterium]
QVLDYLRPGDVMVFNQSRVIPARIRGRRQGTGGRVQLLLLRREGPGLWQALGQPGRSLRPGSIIEIESSGSNFSHLDTASPTGELQIEVIASGEGGIKTVRLSSEEEILRLGEMPLPPYIHHRLEEPERYQTVYARDTGSAAAPTAGLHFTQPLLDRLKDSGVELVFLTLHVGLDTFRPVKGEDPREHQIHTEYYDLGEQAADTLNRARGEKRRIIAVGTTSVRVLEQVAQRTSEGDANRLIADRGQAGLFILPGYRFQVVDAMITNFHLPRSTLLMLVSAFAGREPVLAAYREATAQRYRFYSFGDAMLIM